MAFTPGPECCSREIYTIKKNSCIQVFLLLHNIFKYDNVNKRRYSFVLTSFSIYKEFLKGMHTQCSILQVRSMALSTDCHHAAVGCSDGNLYVYNLRTTELLDGFSGHAHSVTSVCCSSNQHFIFTAAKVGAACL